MKNTTIALCTMLILTICTAEGAGNKQAAALTKKLESIIVPEADFRQANISDVVQFLVSIAKENDPDKTGVNIVLIDKNNQSTITMSLKKVSLYKVLKLVAENAGLTIHLEDQVVVLRKRAEVKK